MRKPTFLLTAVGFAFALWLLACAGVSAQTTSVSDSHWVVKYRSIDRGSRTHEVAVENYGYTPNVPTLAGRRRS